MVDFKAMLERQRAERSLRDTVKQLNTQMEEPLAAPRRTKIKKREKTPNVQEAEGNHAVTRKPPKKVIRLTNKPDKPDPLQGKRQVEQPDTYWTLPYLAKKAGIQEQLARLWLRKAEIEKPGTRWRWKEGSKELARVRKILKLDSMEKHKA